MLREHGRYDGFVLHQRDTRRWAAEADRSQFEEQHSQGAQALEERGLGGEGDSNCSAEASKDCSVAFLGRLSFGAEASRLGSGV